MTSLATPRDQWLRTLCDRFGDDPMNWAFVCPSCADVATGQDFRTALGSHPRQRGDGSAVTASDVLGRECIGRTVPDRGCDWAAYGLFRGPEFVSLPDGTEVPCFAMAPGQQAEAGDSE